MTLDPREYSARRVAETAPALGWERRGPLSPGEWQARLREAVARCVGLPTPSERVPLDARVVESTALDGYRRERVEFATRPGLTAMAYLLVPDGCPPGRPAVLCLPGHGRGVDSIVGIAEDGGQRPPDAPGEYQADFALQCVARGWPTLALEQISFGHRRDAQARAAGPNASSCVRDSMAALMLGETMTGWRVWDALRALDYMETRPECDSARLAVMGISGGGLTALFTAALDARVAACVVSGYLNTFADSILSVNHCPDNYVPGISTVAEMPDIAGLVAPRPLFAESGTDDPIFPVAAFERAVARVREIYAASGAAANFGHEVFTGDHRFHGAGAFRFLEGRLARSG